MNQKNFLSKKTSKRRFFSRQFETVIFVIIILSAFTVLLFIAINDVFPNKGGFTRNIIFIKPSQDGDPGYFIAVDDVFATKRNTPVDWILHGRGNLTVFNNNQSAVWAVKSYLNPDNIIKLYAIFIEPQVTISESSGPFYPTQSEVDNPMMLPFIKARPSQPGSTRIITILYPLNGSQTLPTITSSDGVTHIGPNDLLFSQTSIDSRSFENVTTNAGLLFLRLDGTNISSYVMKKGTRLSYHSRSYLQSDQSISINLDYQTSNVSGMIWVNQPTEISLWVPYEPNQSIFNGKNFTAAYDNVTQIATFTITQNGSLFISYDPFKSFKSQPLFLSSHLKKESPPLVKNPPLKAYGSHPFLYFNEITLPELRNKILTQEPWQTWFSKIETNAKSYNISALLSSTDRYGPALDLAFTGVIRQNMTYINKAATILQAMDEIQDYSSHLECASACSHYSIAFDMVYQNLSSAEQGLIAEKLESHAIPLAEKIDYLPRNNHIGIVASGLGLVGLVLDKSEWVTRAISGVDDYISTSFATDGGNYEGYSYAGYFLNTGLKFFYGLKNVGVKDYFADPKFLSFINSTIYCLSPLTIIPLFEDSNSQSGITEALLWTASHIAPHAPLLSNYSQWVWDRSLLNDGLPGDENYLRTSSFSSGSVSRVCMYSMNITPVQPPLETIVVKPDAGLTFLRSDWGQDALYLAITCKKNSEYQYHAHYDENSFEIWAYGAWLAVNPGYPGYGYGEYDWVTSTEASNTLLMDDEGQKKVNGEGFQEYFSSPELDGVVASANSIYSSTGHYTLNDYFLGVLIFIISCLVAASAILIFLRWRGYKTNIIFLPEQEKSGVNTVKSTNQTLKTHLTLVFGLSFGIIISLVSFFLFTNPYVQVYTVGKHEEIISLIPKIEIGLLILVIPLVILLIAFKFKMQDSLLRRVVIFSTNLKDSQVPPLKDSIKHSYLPQCFFLIIFIPIMLLLYVPLVNDVVNHIFTEGGSLIDIQNYIIGTLNSFILLFTLTYLLYLPFKLWGLYLGGGSLSEKLKHPRLNSILMLTATYLLTLTLFILVIFYISLTLFYALDFLGVSFIV